MPNLYYPMSYESLDIRMAIASATPELFPFLVVLQGVLPLRPEMFDKTLGAERWFALADRSEFSRLIGKLNDIVINGTL